VRVVEVEPSPPPTSLDLSVAREGSKVSYQERACNNASCENFCICRPRGLENGAKVQVVEVKKRLNCPLGHDLVAVEVAYAAE